MRKAAERSGINPQEIMPQMQQPGAVPPGTEGGAAQGLLGPNGQPIEGMNSPATPEGNRQRQALTNEVMNPPRIVP